MEEKNDRLMDYFAFMALCVMIGWLLYKHTGTGVDQIKPLYWAGFATPLFSQVIRQMFNLLKKVSS